MKTIIISDIHGDIDALNSILYKIEIDNVEKLIILGDFCGYGSDSIDIANRLNCYKDKLICVRGNCDTDKFMRCFDIDLPIYQNIRINNISMTITHGHIYNPYYLPDMCGNILISGHTHRSSIKKIDNILCINPGSISRPRDGLKSYALIDNNNILYIKDINDNIIDYCNLDVKIV